MPLVLPWAVENSNFPMRHFRKLNPTCYSVKERQLACEHYASHASDILSYVKNFFFHAFNFYVYSIYTLHFHFYVNFALLD